MILLFQLSGANGAAIHILQLKRRDFFADGLALISLLSTRRFKPGHICIKSCCFAVYLFQFFHHDRRSGAGLNTCFQYGFHLLSPPVCSSMFTQASFRLALLYRPFS